MAKSKLPSPGTGEGSVTKGLLKISKGLAKTAGAIYRGLIGPEQEQTYGWTQQFFPAKEKKEKRVETIPIRPPQNLGPTPGMGMDTEEILNLMKENYADEKRYRQVQQGFAEERANEEEKRHKELVTALKKFTGQKSSATIVAKEKEGGGFLDTIMQLFKAFEEKVKGMIETALSGLDLLKKGALLSNLLKFAGSPIFGVLLGVAGIIGLAELLREAVKYVPDYSKNTVEKLTFEEAKNVLENGDPKVIEYYGRDKLLQKINDEQEKAKKLLETPDLTPEERAAAEKIADVRVAQQTVTELPPAPQRPDETKGLAGRKKAEKWDMLYGQTHNPDGSPKIKLSAKRLLQGVEESTAGAGRGSAQYNDFLARMDEQETGGRASFGVRPKGIKSAATPVPPPPSPVAELTDMNLDLVDFGNYATEMNGSPILQQSNTQSVQNEPPIPSTATQRDEEPMATKVFKDQRSRARAY